MDRGYNDYRLFNWIDKRNTVFVTRLKKNAAHTPLDESTMVGEGNNWSDYHITFTGEAAKEVGSVSIFVSSAGLRLSLLAR